MVGKSEYDTMKYVIKARIEIDGVVEKSDVVGAIFGQTEGLLGEELDLRELQKTGRIGRIRVNLETRGGKSAGTIIVPSSLDRVETAILAATLETVDRVGPCTARVTLEKIEDVREEKRKRIIERAVEILRKWEEEVVPESQEITEQVMRAVRTGELIRYGPEGLPAGPNIDDADTIIVVEGRADVVNLLKHGFRNVIAVEGTNIPKTIIELSRKKNVIAFVDGDRGGELILKELLQVADIDYIARAPPGREVEELTRKEIVKALRSKLPVEQFTVERKREELKKIQPVKLKIEEPKVVREQIKIRIPEVMLKGIEEVRGKGEAIIYGNDFEIVKKTSVGKLAETLQKLDNVRAIVFDGVITQRLVDVAGEKEVEYIIGAVKRDVAKCPVDLSVFTFDDIS